MKFNHIWTNYKIYAFCAGVLLGALVYNYIGIDYSFSAVTKLEGKDFLHSLIYSFIIQLKFAIFIFFLSFFRIRNKIILLIIFYEGFIMSGLIVLSVSLKVLFLLSGAVMSVFKIFSALMMFQPSKRVLNKIFSLLILAVGTIVQNFFLIYF